MAALTLARGSTRRGPRADPSHLLPPEDPPVAFICLVLPSSPTWGMLREKDSIIAAVVLRSRFALDATGRFTQSFNGHVHVAMAYGTQMPSPHILVARTARLLLKCTAVAAIGGVVVCPVLPRRWGVFDQHHHIIVRSLRHHTLFTVPRLPLLFSIIINEHVFIVQTLNVQKGNFCLRGCRGQI